METRGKTAQVIAHLTMFKSGFIAPRLREDGPDRCAIDVMRTSFVDEHGNKKMRLGFHWRGLKPTWWKAGKHTLKMQAFMGFIAGRLKDAAGMVERNLGPITLPTEPRPYK